MSTAKRRRESATAKLGVRYARIVSSVFLAKIVSLILGVVMLVVVARVIGPSQYGIYTLALAAAGFLQAFGNVNVGAYFNKVIPQLKAEGKFESTGTLIMDAILFLSVVSVVMLAAIALLGPLISSHFFGSDIYALYVFIAALGVIMNFVWSVLNTTLVGLGNETDVGYSTVSGITLQSITSIALVLLGFGVMGALLGYVVGAVGSALLTFYYIGRYVKFRLLLSGWISRLRKMLKFLAPLTFSAIISTAITNFAVLILGFLMVPSSLIGQYGVANRVGQIIDVVVGSISVVLIPMFATAIHNRHETGKISLLYQKSIYYGLLFTLPIVVYASVLSYQIIVTIFTSAYSATIIYMPLISIGTVISLVAGYAYSLIISYGRVGKIFQIYVIGGIIQIASVILLGILFQVIGVIIAYFFIGNIVFSFLYIKELRGIGVRIDSKPLVRVALANVILAAALLPLWLLNVRPLYIMILGVIEIILLYPIILAKTKIITKNEFDIFGRIVSNFPLLAPISNFILGYTKRFM